MNCDICGGNLGNPHIRLVFQGILQEEDIETHSVRVLSYSDQDILVCRGCLENLTAEQRIQKSIMALRQIIAVSGRDTKI